MFRKLSAAVVLSSALFGASSAAAATVLDFENFAVGDILTGGIGNYDPRLFVDGLGHIIIKGEIVADPTGGSMGNVLKLTMSPGPRPQQDFFLNFQYVFPNGPGTFPKIRIIPIIETLDVLAPQGATFVGHDVAAGDDWTSLSLNLQGTGLYTRQRVRGPEVYIDNLVVSSRAMQVPEPATWSLLILGFGAAGGALRRRRGSQAPESALAPTTP